MSDVKPNPNSRHSKYSIEGGKLVRKAPFCPQPSCGEGIFLARHADRWSCGKCGYTTSDSEE
ncbi:MAG: 30S ribosomal protein S27ae [Euryarchaeota archaeon]|jgi:small subunit ribosomal protein S27Ae|nr:30S ribosomal protein S27ae [Euryarchaeota archaeon]